MLPGPTGSRDGLPGAVRAQREQTGRRIGRVRQFDNSESSCQRNMARRRIDPRRYDQCVQCSASKYRSSLVGRVGRIDHGASRVRCDGESSDRQFRTVGQHDRDPIMATYSHGPQRASHFADVLIETRVAQRSAAGSKDRRGVGAPPGMMFEQIVEAQKRDGDPRLCAKFIQHGSHPSLPQTISNLSAFCLLEPECHIHFAVHRRRSGEILVSLRLAGAAIDFAETKVAVGNRAGACRASARVRGPHGNVPC